MSAARFSRFVNIAIVITSILIVISCVEITCYFLDKHSPIRTREYPPDYHAFDEMLGYEPLASSENKSSMSIDGVKIYDVTYSIDEYHRRRTPVIGRDQRNNFALFFGCSFTLGEGVNGDETFPYFFAENSHEYIPYNYGFHGYGPQEMLVKLQDPEIKNQIKESQGIAIYLYLADVHEKRAIGSMYVYNRWGKNMPYYALDVHDDLVRMGSFTSGRPIISRLYTFLGYSYFLKYFKIDFPPRISSKDYELTTRIISEARNEFKKKFNDDKFYVVIYPTKNKANIIPYLRDAGIEYFDYSTLFDASLYRIGDGWHPTPDGYKLLAKKLADDISHISNK